jgi:hypothetical protein
MRYIHRNKPTSTGTLRSLNTSLVAGRAWPPVSAAALAANVMKHGDGVYERHQQPEDLPKHRVRPRGVLHEIWTPPERAHHRPEIHELSEPGGRGREHVPVRVKLHVARDELDVASRVAPFTTHVKRPPEQAALLPVPLTVEPTQHLGVHLPVALALRLKHGHRRVELVPGGCGFEGSFARRLAPRRRRRLDPVLRRQSVRVRVKDGRVEIFRIRRVLREHAPLLQVDRDAHAGVFVASVAVTRVAPAVK